MGSLKKIKVVFALILVALSTGICVNQIYNVDCSKGCSAISIIFGIGAGLCFSLLVIVLSRK